MHRWEPNLAITLIDVGNSVCQYFKFGFLQYLRPIARSHLEILFVIVNHRVLLGPRCYRVVIVFRT
jgi:hypothetical protein